jgi:hypothetical protein
MNAIVEALAFWFVAAVGLGLTVGPVLAALGGADAPDHVSPAHGEDL